MSFTFDVKEELTAKPVQEHRRAYLAGFIRAAGSLILADGKFGFEFATESEGAARCAAKLLRAEFSYDVGAGERAADALNKKDRLSFVCTGARAAEILSAIGVLSSEGVRFGAGELSDAEEKRAFLKGVFVGAGNLTVPKRHGEGSSTGYHLGFALSNAEFAADVEKNLISLGFRAKIAARRGGFVPYLKSAEEIKDFLAFIGAPKAALKITDIMIEKEVMASANRQKNCDLANVTKQMDAAEKVIAAIEKLIERGRLDQLKDSLRETALARREYAEETLQELADRLGITKSCLNHRLRKLTELEKESEK
ncbi:MAG: DNA-binding protein WhiA [Bacillota bacterium]|nr:MAG: DNA-binding protein WhiA [Bacillota bacterium]